MALLQKLLYLLIASVLLNSCASHVKNLAPCIDNPDYDYKDLVTIIGKAQCFSKSAFINEPITDEIKNIKTPNVRPVVAVYKFQYCCCNDQSAR